MHLKNSSRLGRGKETNYEVVGHSVLFMQSDIWNEDEELVSSVDFKYIYLFNVCFVTFIVSDPPKVGITLMFLEHSFLQLWSNTFHGI